MRSDQNVVHRKIVTPWYDTETACFLTIALMLVIFLFCIAGFSVASEDPAHGKHIFVPIILLVLCCGIILSTSVRLARRYLNRFQDRYLKDFSNNGY